MAVYYKDGTGQIWEYDTPEEAERQGLLPATPEDIRAHNHALDVEEAGQGTTLQALGEGAERVVGGVAEGIQDLTGLGTAPGLQDEPGGGLSSLQEAYSPEARLRREAHPIAAGIGTGLAATPAAALGGLAGAAALPAAAPLVGGALGAIGAESAVQAVAQEYDDAWLEQRPMELQGVAAKTLMFAGGDLLFRGLLKGGARLLFGAKSESQALGRNLVSEAQGAAREAAPELAPAGGGGSVGAARAADLAEPFDDAIAHMSDRDAAVLARDAEDHLHLIGQNASEAFTRVNQGLTDSLGSRLKYEDFATNAQKWDAPLLQRQAKWLDNMVEQGDDVAREVASFAEGKREAIDFGNLGKKASKLIDSFNQRLAQETDPARRNWMVDNLKKELDGVTMSIDASFGVDDVTRSDLKKLIAPYREGLRKGLENPAYFGANAELQRATNGPWHRFLQDWPAVQKLVLEATGHTQFDQMGAGRIGRESTVDRMLAVLGRDPRSNQEFGRHLGGALDSLQELIEARQARGIAGTEGLEALASDVRNLAEDWNLATTVGVAKNRVAIMKRDPRKWATLALDLGERLPLVGKPIQVGRNLGQAFTDLHLKQGTALDSVWSRAYSRYAKNPAMADPSISRNYADWVVDALNQRGGAVPPPAGAMGAPAAPMANDVMTGSPGFRQAARQYGPPAAGAASIFGATVAGGDAQAVEPAPGPTPAPESDYRQALSEIDKAGSQHITALAASVLRKRTPKPGRRGPLELFAGRGSLEDAVDGTRQRLAQLSSDPAQLVRELGGSVGDLWKTHPSVYTAMVAKAHQLAGYLQQHAPQPTAQTLMDPRGGKLSFDRSWDFAARFIGAAQPKLALREITRGTAPPEMIEAVRDNWEAELWTPFRAELVGQVQRMAAAGRHVPSERLLRLDRMLGLDGQLDPSASSAVAAHFLAAQDAEDQKRQAAGQASGGSAGSSSSASSMRTRLDAINAERTP